MLRAETDPLHMQPSTNPVLLGQDPIVHQPSPASYSGPAITDNARQLSNITIGQHDSSSADNEEPAPIDTAVEKDPTGDTPATPKDTPAEQTESPPSSKANIVDRVHYDVTDRMVAAAQWFDSFFDDERYIEEENRTTLRLQFDTFFEEYEGVDVNVRARLDLKIPALEDKVKLTISGDPDREPSLDESDEDILRPETEEDQQRNISLSAQYFFLDTLNRNASTRAGLTFRGGNPAAFGELRYRAEDTFDNGATRFIPRVRWWTDRGWEVRTDFDLEGPVMDRFFFRTTLAGSWFEDQDGIFYRIRYRLFQTIDTKRALEYEWINDFETEPKHRLTEITYRVRYRQQFWRRWLFFEIAPQVSMPEKREYRFVPGILLRLEMRFDKEALDAEAFDREQR